ncbi:helix-turn-helix domain-containing protein [Oscillospiraceae bacterium OttesenSCG-928-G22]|nr:helix-turn-helix domain-containing protein [Oscillospiraceae bacterium OttesenSCG-928-G22]
MSIELDYKQLGGRIKRYRTAAGLTQEQLADKVDVVTSNISHMERATTQVSLPTLVKIANVLGVSLDQLVCDSLPVSESYLEKDFADLLADCTLEEKRMLKDIVIASKRTIREHK